MIVIKIEINEDKKKKLLNGTGVDVDIHEIGIKTTEAEIEVSNVLKDRIKVNEKLQFIHKEKPNKKDIMKIIESMLEE